MRTTLIRGGTVVLGQNISKQDILIQGETISDLGHLSGKKADAEIDASGLLVLPGAVDTHVHFNDEFMNTASVHDFYKGTLAAAYGGVTSIIDFANQAPGQSLASALEKKKKEAEGEALVDWGVHPVITEATPEVLEEIPLMVIEGAPTIKCYMTYRKEGLMVEAEELRDILKALRYAGGMLMVHAEDNEIIEKNISRMIRSRKTQPIFHAKSRPPEAEEKAINRCLQLVRESYGRLFIVHLASAEGMELIGAARREGLDIIAETCTHYLVFTEKMLERKDGIKWICSPPLRSQAVQDKLWEGLRDGRISMVSSDDAAYSWEAKLYGADRFDKCPNGIPGIEPRLCLLYSEGVVKRRLTLPRLVELVSTVPAILFGLAPKKGTLTPGADADIVLLDPEARWTMNQQTLHMAADWAAYEDIEITGKIAKVFSRGELVIDGEECLAQKGRGRYLRRKLNFS
jgi:dihydropyrimidinase